MNTAVIGTGFLGVALVRALSLRGHAVVPTHHRNQKFDDSLSFDFFRDDPEIIFAGKSIDLVIIPAKIEFVEDSAALDWAMERFISYFRNARVVYISSDGIFDGTKGDYAESDQIHPVTLYGRNLKLCETLVRNQAKNHCIIRPSYMYGFVSGVLDERLEAARTELNQGKEVLRFTDMYKSPLSYWQAAETITALALSDYVGTVHISGERMSVYDFTREGMEALGVPTMRLRGVLMPIPQPEGMLADTSLNSALAQELTDIVPLRIQESLRGNEDKRERMGVVYPGTKELE